MTRESELEAEVARLKRDRDDKRESELNNLAEKVSEVHDVVMKLQATVEARDKEYSRIAELIEGGGDPEKGVMNRLASVEGRMKLVWAGVVAGFTGLIKSFF